MWTEIKAAYRGSWKVAFTYPLLLALPAAAELAQHVAEYGAGMFASAEGMKAAADNGWRMGLGVVKITILLLLGYWVSRALAALDGASLRVRGDGRSARLFGWVVAWSLAMGLPQLFGRGWITPFVSGRAALIIGVTYFLVLLACDTYLIVWKIGASLGNARLSFIASFRVMHGNFWWSLLYIMVMSLPLMVVHYALNLLAVGRPPALIWAMLGADALTAGYLGIVLATTTYMIARRATARRGEPLLP